MGFIPDRWLDYTPCGKPVENVPIVAFKTPLSERYHRPPNCKEDGAFLEENQQFTPEQLCEQMEELGYELAVIIDLTFTFRYYDGIREFDERHDIQYEKVKCEGQRVPSDKVSNRVFDIINDVIYRHGRDSKKLVGIHCTHGVNRTGYLVCRYLIEWLGYTPEKAIEAFNVSRGYNMEREAYIKDLMERTPKTRFDEYKANKEEYDVYDQNDRDESDENLNDFERFTEPKTIANNRHHHEWDAYADEEYRQFNYDAPWRGKYRNSHRFYRDNRRSDWNSSRARRDPYRRNPRDDSKFYRDVIPSDDNFISGPSDNDQFSGSEQFCNS